MIPTLMGSMTLMRTTTGGTTVESSEIAPKGAIFFASFLEKKLDKIRTHRKESIRVTR
jgi:hypothetical protein